MAVRSKRRANLMRSSTMERWLIAALVLLAVPMNIRVAAQQHRQGPFRRARPPRFQPSDSEGIFFADVFREGVVGERPASATARSMPVPTRGPNPGTGTRPAAGGKAPPLPAGGGWSKLVSAATIEDEVKRIKIKVDQAIATPTRFRSQDYQTCRQQFSILAMLFGIIDEFDGQVRWKEHSGSLRDAFARAAGNCRSDSDMTAAFNEARLRKADLQDAIGGGSVNLPAAPPRSDWEGVCERAPLMQRLEQSEQSTLRPYTASAGEFQSHVEDILHEAELVAAIGEVMQREGMMDAEDDDYKALTEEMKQAALGVIEAVRSNDAGAASKAVGEISKSCNACHDLYRG